MRSCLAAAAVAIACQAAFAQPDDRAHSAACRQALEALQAQEAAAAAASSPQGNPRQQAARKRLPALQREAATACLGGGRAERRSPPAGARVSPPVSVAPVTVMPPPALPQGGPPAPALTMPAPPLTVTACDAAGCLASDGTRLQWAGPNLLGPRGMCTVQGSLLQCP
ncbi:hypothetical protein [Methylibium rhizosphaerae]|uniref:hypothetical protein n=1 Tax=Methylibium rhizosphaerae TaxID=2570323 RepID=UPI00112895AC|nr:hypothetical protein [Methylibium rhizosphaerae]